MKTILIFILCMCNSVLASDSVVIHGLSYHPQNRGLYNEVNSGIGYRKYKDNIFLTIGTYRNSLYNQSIYAGIGFNVTDNINVIGGYITGYPSNNKIIVPEFHFNITKYTKINIMYIPHIKNVVEEVIGFSLEIQ